jgi:RNA polymerase sigma-70 factor (ECF subfamily)
MAAVSSVAAPRPLDPQLLASHMDRMLRFARHLCGRDGDAEDLVQDTLERVLRRPRMVTGSETAYLLTAMRNTHHSRLRALGSRVRTTTLPDELEPVDDLAEARPMTARRAREVLDAVAALPEPFREAVVLVDIRGFSSVDAARELGVAEGTLASRLHRGRARVARACEPGDA